MHPPESSPVRGSQALAPPEVPNWLDANSVPERFTKSALLGIARIEDLA
jgi:hypothetical protein